MIQRQVQPVYLAVPSRGVTGLQAQRGLDPVIAGFVDGLAMSPATAERVLLGIVEYSTFTNELCPLGPSLEQAARVSVSGFAGVDFAALFDGVAKLLHYDRYRLVEQGMRTGRPHVAVIVDVDPDTGDDWQRHRLALTDVADESSETAPVIVAVAAIPAALNLATAMAYPAPHCALASTPAQAGELAASIVVRALALWGIGIRGGSTPGPQRRESSE